MLTRVDKKELHVSCKRLFGSLITNYKSELVGFTVQNENLFYDRARFSTKNRIFG